MLWTARLFSSSRSRSSGLARISTIRRRAGQRCSRWVSAYDLDGSEGHHRLLVDKALSRRSRDKAPGVALRRDGEPDLGKIQMMAFTMIAAVIYLFRMTVQESSPPEMADIEAALMVLMGLSQGAYLGKKLMTIATPRITGMSPTAVAPGTLVTLTGTSFGGASSGSAVTMAGASCHIPPTQTDVWLEFVSVERAAGIRVRTATRSCYLISTLARPPPFDLVITIAPG